ncbi:hypothetical protein GJ496_008166, partial [Pomphorhynchus laevis]
CVTNASLYGQNQQRVIRFKEMTLY